MKALKKYFLLVFFSSLVINVSAGKLDQAFEALKIHNYFEAKRLFEKTLKSEPTGGSYGLSLIFVNAKNPFYHLDSALKYIEMAETAFPAEKEKSRLKLNEFGIDANTINIHKMKIGNMAYQYAVEANTLESFNHFIKTYEYSGQLPFAVDLRDSIAFD